MKRVTKLVAKVDELVSRDWLYVANLDEFYKGNEEESAKYYGVPQELLDDIENALTYLADEIASHVGDDLRDLYGEIEDMKEENNE